MGVTDQIGTFRIPSGNVNSYFGKPQWKISVYHPHFRQEIQGSRFNLTDTLLVDMWPESAASQFSVNSGRRIDYESAVRPEALRRSQEDRGFFLNRWLGASGIVQPCEFEPASKQREAFVMDLYRQWIPLAGTSTANGGSLACSAFSSFHLDNPDKQLASEFLILRDQVNQLCAAARHRSL